MLKSEMEEMQQQYGYAKEEYDDLINLLSKNIDDGLVDTDKEKSLKEIIGLTTLGGPSDESNFIIHHHMDFDFSKDKDQQVIDFIRSFKEVGIEVIDNYDEYPSKEFVGVSMYKTKDNKAVNNEKI